MAKSPFSEKGLWGVVEIKDGHVIGPVHAFVDDEDAAGLALELAVSSYGADKQAAQAELDKTDSYEQAPGQSVHLVWIDVLIGAGKPGKRLEESQG